VSDAIGVHANDLTAKVGGERWWPTTDDFPAEVAKCVRILRAFTVDGIEKEVADKDDKGMTKKRKVFKKIPAEVIRNAKGICVYTSFRTGVAPFGGAGGSGVIVARLPDGTWSAPSVIAPGNFAAGLMLGVCVLALPPLPSLPFSPPSASAQLTSAPAPAATSSTPSSLS